eukprot:EG_transcript_21439
MLPLHAASLSRHAGLGAQAHGRCCCESPAHRANGDTCDDGDAGDTDPYAWRCCVGNVHAENEETAPEPASEERFLPRPTLLRDVRMRLQLATEFAGLVFTLEDMVEASRGDALDLLAREGMADVVVLVPDCPSLKMWQDLRPYVVRKHYYAKGNWFTQPMLTAYWALRLDLRQGQGAKGEWVEVDEEGTVSWMTPSARRRWRRKKLQAAWDQGQ